MAAGVSVGSGAGKFPQSAPVDLGVVPQGNENVELRFVELADISGSVIFQDESARPGASPRLVLFRDGPNFKPGCRETG